MEFTDHVSGPLGFAMDEFEPNPTGDITSALPPRLFSVWNFIPGFRRVDPAHPRERVEARRSWVGIALFAIVFALCKIVMRRVCKKLRVHDELEAWAVAEVARKAQCKKDGVPFQASLTPAESRRRAAKEAKAKQG